MMAKLMFFDSDHRYEIDGEELPSVSEITRFVSREVYGDVTQFQLDNAADRGTKVHKATEVLDKYGKAEIDDELVPYLQAYVKFRTEHPCEWEKIEYANYSEKYKFAGTIDRYGKIDGKEHCLLDIKTSYQIQKVLYGAGQNLYKIMLEENKMPVEKMYILHLKKDGTYKLVELEMNDEVAKACLTLHEALKKKSRKKK